MGRRYRTARRRAHRAHRVWNTRRGGTEKKKTHQTEQHLKKHHKADVLILEALQQKNKKLFRERMLARYSRKELDTCYKHAFTAEPSKWYSDKCIVDKLYII